jgi:formyltetrahydrofolate hydrolase
LQAKETLNDILSARAFEALDIKKQEIAQTLYNNGENIEVQDTADSEVEDEELLTQEEFESLSEEDQELYLEALEQLDELSKTTLISKRAEQKIKVVLIQSSSLGRQAKT